MKTKAPVLPPVADYIRNLTPYAPGKPIEEVERELGIKDIIKLASNENPLGPAPKAIDCLQNLNLKEDLRLYPDGGHYFLREKLAQELGISMEELLIGNGSNEIIDFLVRAYCSAGDNIVSCANAFVAYRISAQVHGVSYLDHPSNDSLTADVDAMLELVNEKTRIVFLPNPNNPTGTFIKKAEIERLIEGLKSKNVLLALDYAYWEYVENSELPNPMQFVENHSNVIVLQTFSKIYGLASLRVGYGIAHPELLAPLNKVKMPFNVSTLSLKAARAALSDIQHLKNSFEVNRAGHDYFHREFERMGIEYWPSQANFILAKFTKSVLPLYDALLAKGVIVRPVIGYGLKEHLRISVGTASENKRFIASIEELL